MPTGNMKDTFSAAYDQFADDIFKYAFSRTGNREVAKDITQDTFMKTWLYLAGGGQIEHMKAFLFRTMQNLIIDFYRKKKEEPLDQMMDVGFDPPDSSGEDVELQAEIGLVFKQLDQLDHDAREILTLRYVNGFDLDEIADLLDISKNVASVRINRAIEKLREVNNV